MITNLMYVQTLLMGIKLFELNFLSKKNIILFKNYGV